MFVATATGNVPTLATNGNPEGCKCVAVFDSFERGSYWERGLLFFGTEQNSLASCLDAFIAIRKKVEMGLKLLRWKELLYLLKGSSNVINAITKAATWLGHNRLWLRASVNRFRLWLAEKQPIEPSAIALGSIDWMLSTTGFSSRETCKIKTGCVLETVPALSLLRTKQP